MFLANSLALKLAGITESTPNPPNGEIVKDATGRLTGVLKGSAADLVRKVIPPIPFEQRLVQVRAVLKEAREGGVTTMQDLTSADQLRAYQELQRRGELTSRIMLRPTLDNVTHTAALGHHARVRRRVAAVHRLQGVGRRDHGQQRRDVLRARTLTIRRTRGCCATSCGRKGRTGPRWAMTAAQHYTEFPPGNLEKLLETAVATGLPPHIHAIGDKGNRIILDVYEKLLTKHGLVNRDHRWRVIHAQVVHPDDFARFGKLRLVAEVNPYHVSDDMRWMEERIGRDRSRGAYAFRTLKDAGAVLIFGSDSPGHQRGALLPQSGLRSLRGGVATDAERRTAGRLVPRSAADHRGSDRGVHESAGLGVVRGGSQRHPLAGPLRRPRGLRHQPGGSRQGQPAAAARRRRVLYTIAGGRVSFTTPVRRRYCQSASTK